MIDRAKEHPLAQRRIEKGLSRKQLSALLNGSPSAETIGRIERGERSPREDTIDLLAGVLECEPDYLRGRIKYPNRITSEVADHIPLSRKSIELLSELKSKCDRNTEGSRLLAELVDEMIQVFIDDSLTGGFSSNTLDMLRTMSSGIKVVNEFEKPVRINGRLSVKRSLNSLRADPPEEYQLAKWKITNSQNAITDGFNIFLREFAEKHMDEIITEEV